MPPPFPRLVATFLLVVLRSSSWVAEADGVSDNGVFAAGVDRLKCPCALAYVAQGPLVQSATVTHTDAGTLQSVHGKSCTLPFSVPGFFFGGGFICFFKE